MSSHTHGNKNRSALRFLTSQNFVNGSCQTAWPIECQQWCWPIKTALTSSMADAFGVLLTAFLQTVTFIWVQLITASLDLISLEDFLWYNWSHMQHWSSHPSSYCRLHLAPGVFHYTTSWRRCFLNFCLFFTGCSCSVKEPYIQYKSIQNAKLWRDKDSMKRWGYIQWRFWLIVCGSLRNKTGKS